jgi:hypothetical protein
MDIIYFLCIQKEERTREDLIFNRLGENEFVDEVETTRIFATAKSMKRFINVKISETIFYFHVEIKAFLPLRTYHIEMVKGVEIV